MGTLHVPAWSRPGARPAQTVRTERGPSIPHRLRAASRAADVGSHGYRLSLQTGRQGSEVAHGDAKCVGCRENRSGCRISAWAGGGPDTGMAGEAPARPLTPPMPHGERALDRRRRCEPGRGPSIPHRLRAASRAADVGSHGYPEGGRSGDRRKRRVSRKSVGGRISAWGRRRAGHRHGGRSAGETSDTTDAPREGSMAIPAMSPTSRDAAVTPTAANVPLPREPAPGSAPAGPRSAMSRMPKEPESRRNPGESARAAPSLVRHAGPPAGEPVHAMRAGEGRASRRSSKTEGTREPRQSWGLRAGGAAKRTLPCGNVSWKWSAESWTFSGCGLTSAEAQPLSAPAVRPWTR